MSVAVLYDRPVRHRVLAASLVLALGASACSGEATIAGSQAETDHTTTTRATAPALESTNTVTVASLNLLHGLPVEQWTLSTLPVLRTVSRPISGLSRSAQLTTLDTEFGPVDIINTHFVASIDNLPCDDRLCGDMCTPGELAGDCNPIEVLDLVERAADPQTPTIIAGDLNADPLDERISVLQQAGFFDSVGSSTRLECVPEEGLFELCTSGIDGPGPYEGLDRPDRTFNRQIDFILFRRIERDCRFGDATGPWLDQPAAEPADGVYWASDHAGVLTEFMCV